jgi:pectate lyase
MEKKLLLFAIILLTPIFVLAQTVTVNESAGWLESAYVKWQPVDGATSYNVYYSGEGITNQKIDDQLIRSYGTYYRADILGLKPGTYTINVVPVISGVEGTGTTTGSLTVRAYDRSGYAFWGNRIPGAYNADGTLKDGAVVLYITENTKNKVSMSVTGATTNPCVGLQTIIDGFKKGRDNRPLVIRLIGNITDLNDMYNGDIVIENNNNASGYITMEGVGDDAVANGWGIRIKGATNIEVRNVGSMNCNSTEGDDIGLQQDNDHIWIHNCDLFYGDAGSDADQVKGDGSIDTKLSTYITISYNHFWDNGKCCLLGLSEDTTSGLFITYHHNWFDHSDSRHPRVRFYSAHVYNNYYDGNAKYGVGSTMGSSVFEEANYFRNCKYPMLTSLQGTDEWDESNKKNNPTTVGIFSGEDGGTIKAYNNYMEGQHRFVAYNDTSAVYNIAGVISSTTDFDAYVVTTRNEQVPATVVSKVGNNTYNNFDTNSSLIYAYTPDSPQDAKTNVMNYAGRTTGGDFKWTFDNAVDDASSLVNTALKAAITNYKTDLISVQGDSVAVKDSTSTGGGSGSFTPGDLIQNFTTSGITSTFYTILGNLSTSYGTISYNGLSLTQCLKMQSNTDIEFTTTEAGTLTLVLNSTYTATVKVDDIAYTPSAGIITIPISVGSHKIIKGSGSNYLFYMSVVYDKADGIGNTNASSATTLYPNPVTNSLSISSNANVKEVEIYSLAGALVKQIEGNMKSVDMSQLSKGSYLVKVITEQGTIKQLILKN